MSLTPTQLQELQTIVVDLGEEFPHNADALWNAAIRIQKGDLGPVTGSGGVPAFEAAVADIKLCQEAVQNYQQRQGSPNSGFGVAVLQAIGIGDPLPSGNQGEIMYIETAPNIWAAVDQILITPAGPNSVQIDEVGTTVFRTVPAASGGVEVNNLATGAGFERVLTVSDTPSGTLPVVTTDMAMLVADLAGNDWDEAPTLTYDDANASLTIDRSGSAGAANPAININATRPSDIIIRMGGVGSGSTNYVGLRMEDQVGTRFFQFRHNYSLSTPNHEFTLECDQFGTLFEFENEGNLYISGTEGTSGIWIAPATDQFRLRNDFTLYIEEKAAANADVAAFGQLWVRDDVPNVLMFRDDTGVDINLSGGVLPTSSAEGEVLVGNGSGGWREGFGVLMQASATPPTADEGYLTFNSTGTVDVRRSQIFMESQNTTSTAFFFETANDDGFYQRIVGNGADRIMWGREVSSVDTDMFSIREDASIRVEAGGNFFMTERAAAAGDIIAHGQFWVRDDAPNVPMFTDDDGTDFVLAGAGSGQLPVLNSDASGTNTLDWRTDFNPRLYLGPDKAGSAAEIVYVGQCNLFASLTSAVGNIFRVYAGSDTLDNHISLEHNTTRGRLFTNSGYIELVAGNGAADMRLSFGTTLKIGETASAQADTATFGQLWVNSADDSLNYTTEVGVNFDLTAAGGTPGGANTQVQFNNAGAFGGSANFTWDGTDVSIGGATGQLVFTGAAHECISLFSPDYGIGVEANAAYITSNQFIRFYEDSPDGGTSDTFEFDVQNGDLDMSGNLVTLGILIDINNSAAATAASMRARNSAGGISLGVDLTTGNGHISQISSGGGVEEPWINFIRNGAVIISANDVPTLDIAGNGLVDIRSVGNVDTEQRILQFTHQDGSIRGSIGQSAALNDMSIRNSVDNGAFSVLLVPSGGGSTAFYRIEPDPNAAFDDERHTFRDNDNTIVFRMNNPAFTDIQMGAQVADGDGTLHAVGMHAMPPITQNADITFDAQDFGRMFIHDEGTTRTWTVDQLSDAEIGSIIGFININGTGTISLDPGAGVAFEWWDGSAYQNSTATRTCGEGQFTIYKRSDIEYVVTGPNMT